MTSSRDLLYNMMTIVNDNIWYSLKLLKKVDSKFSHQNRNESGKVATNELNLGILQYTTTSKHVIYHKHIKFLFNYIINLKIETKNFLKALKGFG